MRAMKDSGVEWLGEVPAGWGLRQAGQLANQTKTPNEGMAETNLLSLSYGKVKRRDINATDGLLPASFETYNIIEPDDIVLRFTDLQNDQKSLRVGRATERGIITSAYVTVRPFDPSCSRFMYYALHAYDLRKGFYGMGAGVRQGLKWQEAKYIELPWPSEAEQARIADFLDAKCAEVDRAVSAAEQSIQEYKAYKNSVVFQAVTKGLDLDAPMKDSGVEWLGEVPAGWRVTPIKHLFYISKKIAGKTGYDVLSITQRGLKIKDIKSGEGQLAADYSHYQLVEPGDFAMNHMDLLTGWIDIASQVGVTSPDYRVFKSRIEQIDKRYFLRVFQYYYSGRIFYGFCKGISSKGRWRLPADAFGNTYIPVPPVPEQTRIADFLDAKCADVDRIVEAKQAIIDELKSYKQSLIYEAVTGKLEV
jgi:type I restriction enzyme, S subunit